MKIGDVVKDKITDQYGLLVSKNPKISELSFEWEVLTLKGKFNYEHIWVDGRKEKDLSLRSHLEYAKSLITDEAHADIISDLSFINKIKILFMKGEK